MKRTITMWNEKDPIWYKMCHHYSLQIRVFNSRRLVMFCFWWDWKNTPYYEILPRSETLNANRYCFQMDWFRAEIVDKPTELKASFFYVFSRYQHDIAHSGSMTKANEHAKRGTQIIIIITFTDTTSGMALMASDLNAVYMFCFNERSWATANIPFGTIDLLVSCLKLIRWSSDPTLGDIVLCVSVHEYE